MESHLSIKISQPDAQQLKALGVQQWPIWTKEASQFPWSYDATETCFILDGEVEVTPDGGEMVRFGVGDLVTFPAGMSCHWNIIRDVRKHYTFE